MKIIKGRVNWRDRWANRPNLELLVDKLCCIDEMIYSELDGFHYAEYDGAVHFLFNSDNHGGFGGRPFKLKIADGLEKTLVGPWSSRSSVANKLGFTPCINAVMVDTQKDWDGGHVYVGGACTIELVRTARNVIRIGDGIHSVCGWGEDFAFPCNSSFTLAKYIAHDGEIFYEPAVRLPDGQLWLKQDLQKLEKEPEDVFGE